MFNVGLTYKITDWINLAARYRMDDTYVKFERKIYDIFRPGFCRRY